MPGPKNNSAAGAAAAAPRTKSLLQNVFSLSSISSFAALFYVYFAFTNLLNLMYPLRNVPERELRNAPRERAVHPLWDEGGGGGGGGALGLRVYLSSEPDFSLDFLSRDDDFGAEDGDGTEGASEGGGGPAQIRGGKSFLLWSEDDALEATKDFSSRSFVLVASDDPSASPDACDASENDSDRTCSSEQQEAAKSLAFAHKWLEDSIQHEAQLESDGGGLMAAMNSAGGGIESTSVLLTVYTSLHRNLKHLVESAIRTLSGGGSDGTTEEPPKQQQTEQEAAEEPKTTVRISPHNPLWRSLMSNGTAYVHVLVVRQLPSLDQQQPRSHLISSSADSRSAARHLQRLHSQHSVLFGKVAMVKRELPLHVPSPKRLLYRDVLYVLKKYILCPFADDGTCSSVPPWDVSHHQARAQEEYALARRHKAEGTTYPYFKPEVRIHLVRDDAGYPLDYANRVGFEIVRVGGGRGGRDPRHPSGYAEFELPCRFCLTSSRANNQLRPSHMHV